MKKIFLLTILSVFISFRVFSFEPYSGISCQNFNTQKKDDFFLSKTKIIYMQLLTRELMENL